MVSLWYGMVPTQITYSLPIRNLDGHLTSPTIPPTTIDFIKHKGVSGDLSWNNVRRRIKDDIVIIVIVMVSHWRPLGELFGGWSCVFLNYWGLGQSEEWANCHCNDRFKARFCNSGLEKIGNIFQT